MKLLLAASLYPPETRGPATFAGQLVAYLSRGKGVEVEVVKFSDVRNLPHVVRHLAYAWRLLWRGRGSRVVLALDPVSVGIPALIVATALHAKLVLRVGGDYAWEQGVRRWGVRELLDEFVAQDKRVYPLALRLIWKLQCVVARRAYRVVVPSKYLKGIVERWGVSSEHVVVIPSAAANGTASIDKRGTRQRVGWGSEAVVFSVGELVPWKGFPALIKAVGSLRAEFPGIRLIIAGGGDQERLRRKAAAAGFDPDMVFLGVFPNVIMRDLLAAADVFALNTAYEGLSHAIIEAMHAGVPIVTTPAGGNPELIEDGTTGLLVQFDDVIAFTAAIRRVLVDSTTGVRLASAARAKAESLTPAVSMRAWEKLLKSL